MGGPTFGIDVKGEEILRFDAHGPRGHWHKGGYDKLGAGGSHQDFPEGVVETASQLAWSLAHLRAHGQQLLAEAGHPAAAAALDPAMLSLGLRRRGGACGARKAICAHTPSPKACWWPNVLVPAPVGRMRRPQGHACWPCAPLLAVINADGDDGVGNQRPVAAVRIESIPAHPPPPAQWCAREGA